MREETYQFKFAFVIEYIFSLNTMGAGTLHEHVKEDLNDLLTHKGKGPSEDIHVVRKHEGMLRVVVLLNLNLVIFES